MEMSIEEEKRKDLEQQRIYNIKKLEGEKSNLELKYEILREGKKVNKMRFSLGVVIFILAIILFIFSANFIYNPPETSLNVSGLSTGFILAGVVSVIVSVITLFNSQQD